MPDLFIGVFDYPDSPNHPAFNLVLRVNFEWSKENYGFGLQEATGLCRSVITLRLRAEPRR